MTKRRPNGVARLPFTYRSMVALLNTQVGRARPAEPLDPKLPVKTETRRLVRPQPRIRADGTFSWCRNRRTDQAARVEGGRFTDFEQAVLATAHPEGTVFVSSEQHRLSRDLEGRQYVQFAGGEPNIVEKQDRGIGLDLTYTPQEVEAILAETGYSAKMTTDGELLIEGWNDCNGLDQPVFGHWRNAMFQPRWCARYRGVIVSRAVQPLGAISEEDAVAEGFGVAVGDEELAHPPRERFFQAWEKLFGHIDGPVCVIVYRFVRTGTVACGEQVLNKLEALRGTVEGLTAGKGGDDVPE